MPLRYPRQPKFEQAGHGVQVPMPAELTAYLCRCEPAGRGLVLSGDPHVAHEERVGETPGELPGQVVSSILSLGCASTNTNIHASVVAAWRRLPRNRSSSWISEHSSFSCRECSHTPALPTDGWGLRTTASSSGLECKGRVVEAVMWRCRYGRPDPLATDVRR